MSDAAVLGQPMRFSDKVRVTAACALAMALFGSLGWTIARPADPQMAVTLLLENRAWPAVLVSVLVLAAVSSAVAAAVAGKAMADAGVLAAACGLAMMSVRGGTMTQVLMYHGTSESERRTLATAFGIETLLWFAAIASAWLVGHLVRSWLDGLAAAAEASTPRSRWARVREAFTHVRHGMFGMVVCAALAWLFIGATMSRTAASAIERGQVFFALGAGFFVGAAVAQQIWAKGAACWYGLSVLIVALLGYSRAALNPVISAAGPLESYARLATTPPNDLARALPIEYMGMGVAGVILGHWVGRRMHYARIAQKAAS